MSAKDGYLFLKSLKEDGIEQIYRDPDKRKSKRLSVLKIVPAQNILPITDSATTRDALIELREKALKCALCHELASTRKNVVFGSGSIKAELMFVGEAPGADEDDQGLPFVGKAGQLLTKIIESIGLSRDKVFIANTLKCRPPQNRPPQPQEIDNCRPFLDQQIALIRPKIICALGTFAGQALLLSTTPISRLREKFHDYPADHGIKVLCTFHPAYLLRNPGEKRKVWEDMKMIKRELEQTGTS